MGNSNNKGNEDKQQKHDKEVPYNPEITRIFNELTNGDELKLDCEKFQKRAGIKLGNAIWKWANVQEMSLEQFIKCANSLSGQSSHGIIKILQPPQNLFECCLEAGGIPIQDEDDVGFILSIIDQIAMQTPDDQCNIESMDKWINENCPRLFEPLRNKLDWIFYGKNQDKVLKNELESEILRPIKMFILRQSLPTTIFWPKPASHATLCNGFPEEWIRLYSSSKNGLSINRFEANVFEYRGPTLAIFQLFNGTIFAIAADEEWRHSSKPFGGPNSMLFKFYPKFERIDSSTPAIYCNFKNRSSQMGIKYGRQAFSVNEDMSDVQQIEVWGCAGTEVLDEQRKMKLRHKLQAERNAKVPLPGNWDENPDKSILEMGGVNLTNERRDYKKPYDGDG